MTCFCRVSIFAVTFVFMAFCAISMMVDAISEAPRLNSSVVV